MKTLIFVLLLGFVSSSCSERMIVSYQPESTNTGRIILKPSKATDKTFVSINDSLIVDKKTVKSVTINNVPEGNSTIHYTSDSRSFKEKVDVQITVNVQDDEEIIKPIDVPPYKPIVFVGPIILFSLGLVLFISTLGRL